jgi:hypothetical protein
VKKKKGIRHLTILIRIITGGVLMQQQRRQKKSPPLRHRHASYSGALHQFSFVLFV